MKPISIEFQAFGPYAGHEIVEFDKVAAKGLFLICGKTGIGKTMLLDAITFALYGKSSGHSRDDFSSMRCTRAAYDAITFVKFVFENKGIQYCFERRIERKKKNLSLSYSLLYKDAAGIWQTMLENPKEKDLSAKAAEIIGLEYEQFCQVIILPQGKFEKLLTSNSEEKEKILTSIFGEEKWQKIAEYFFAETDSRLAKLKEIQDRILRSLRDEKCETIAELDRLIEDKISEVNRLKDDFEAHGYNDKIREQEDMLTIAGRFEDLRKAQKKIAELRDEEQTKKLWEKQSKDAERAEKVRPLLENLNSEKEAVTKRENDWKSAEGALKKAGIALEEAQTNLQNHSLKEEEYNSGKLLKIKYEGLKEEYAGIDEVRKELISKTSIRDNAKEDEKTASDLDEKLKADLTRIKEEYESLNEKHNDMLQAYIHGITGELAGKLKEGEPCPVCGSTQHPHKATVSDNNVSKEKVDSAKEAADEKYLELKNVMKKEEEAKRVFNEKHTLVEEAQRSLDVTGEKLEGLKKKMVPGIASLEDLEAAIDEQNKKITEYEKTTEELTNKLTSAKEKNTEAVSRLQSAKNEMDAASGKKADAEQKLKKALADNGFGSEEEAGSLMISSEERTKLSEAIHQYEADVRTAEENCKNIKAELEGKAETDSAIIRETIEELKRAVEEYRGNKAVLDNETARLQEKAKRLKEEGEGIEERMREAEADCLFAKRLRGERGTGLQRYVLGIMFSTVIAAANRMLEKIHGGRYRLYRSDEKAQGTNKRGLELKVYDSFSADHEGRFVNSLSGGEKFLVSLALSIGMSTIAQQSGIRIEALFIDEGFGSLDEDSINDAMDVLNSIQKANGIVGIISHVKILQEQIPTKLCVEADAKGSHITASIG